MKKKKGKKKEEEEKGPDENPKSCIFKNWLMILGSNFVNIRV